MGDSRTILVADDEGGIRALLEVMCQSAGYTVVTARDGLEALRVAAERRIDLVILDGVMPGLDGFETTRRLKADPALMAIPVIMLTGLLSREDRLRGIAAGANDFLTKPLDQEELILRVKNNLTIKEFADFLRDHGRILEQEVAARTGELKEALGEVTAANRETVIMLAVASEYKDVHTGGHIHRIRHYAKEIARTMGRDDAFQDTIFYASAVHDIGKVYVPDSIMLKPGALNAAEWEVVRGHTLAGERMLAGTRSAYLLMGREIAGGHHELWDGSGYPRGLAGAQIPLPARMTTIVDQYDALRTARPYKQALTHDQALVTLLEGDGRTMPVHFDPEVLAAFRECAPRMREISESFSDSTHGSPSA